MYDVCLESYAIETPRNFDIASTNPSRRKSNELVLEILGPVAVLAAALAGFSDEAEVARRGFGLPGLRALSKSVRECAGGASFVDCQDGEFELGCMVPVLSRNSWRLIVARFQVKMQA
jgi:hypothetical protein